MRKWLVACLAVALLGAAPAAWAQNLAVIIANTAYRDLPYQAQFNDVLRLRGPLQSAGFEVIEVTNLRANNLVSTMPEVAQRLQRAEKVVVVLSGYYASLRGRSYLLTIDQTERNAFSIGRFGLAFDAIWATVQAKQGNAIVAVATNGDRPTLGPGLGNVHHLGNIPQGVTVVEGSPSQVAGFLPKFLAPGRPMLQVSREAPNGVRVLGFVSHSGAFLEQVQPADAEDAAWQRALAGNTVEGYRQFILNFPTGRYADEARAKAQALLQSPEDRARLAEEALNLNKNRRARLQQYLTILGYDTRGVDGVFGPRTRNAIGAWQASLGTQSTGYLTGNQVARIEQDGAARAEELRREAEQRQREAEAQDRAFWQQTGASGTEQGVLAYLQRYPSGLFADQANARLKQIEREKRRQARAEERRAWDNAVIIGTIQSYRGYLRAYPNGTFAATARSRVQALAQNGGGGGNPAAEQAENALQLDPFRKRLIETQLDRLGLSPGVVDGDFDHVTRRAISRFQQQNNLPVTGYVSRDLMVLLLVSALGR